MRDKEGKVSLQGFRVAILVTDGFEQVELERPRRALQEAGAETVVASPKSGTVQGMNHYEKGGKVKVDAPISRVKPEDFDAVLLPGGVVNADMLRMDEDARRIVKAIEKDKKPIAVICHGPWLLVSSGLVKGRQLTSFFTLQDDIRNAGGKRQDKEALVDSNWVSSRKPDDIPAFNEAMLNLFAQSTRKTRSAQAD
jgi:protease I